MVSAEESDKKEVDFAIGYFPEMMTTIVTQGPQSAWRHQTLYDSKYVCVMRKDHALATQELDLDAFCSAHHVLVSFSGQPYGFVDQAMARLDRTRRIVLTVNQFFTAAQIVVNSDLLTVLPRTFLPVTGLQDALIVRPIPLQVSPVRVEMIWHRRHDLHPAHTWMRQTFVQASTYINIPE